MTDRPLALPQYWQIQLPCDLVFNGRTNQLRAFQLVGSSYTELELLEPRVWMNNIQLGLGLWQGFYGESDRVWLRWYDADGNWILTPQERESQLLERERRRVERLAEQLRSLGVEPDLDAEV